MVGQEPQTRHRGHHHPQSPAFRRAGHHKGPPGEQKVQVGVGRGHRVAQVVDTDLAHRGDSDKVGLYLGHIHKEVQSHPGVAGHRQVGAAHCKEPQNHLSPGQDREHSPYPRLHHRDSSTLCRWPAGLVVGDCRRDQARLPASTLPDCHQGSGSRWRHSVAGSRPAPVGARRYSGKSPPCSRSGHLHKRAPRRHIRHYQRIPACAHDSRSRCCNSKSSLGQCSHTLRSCTPGPGRVGIHPHLSGHSGLHWALGSPGREDTMTGIQLSPCPGTAGCGTRCPSLLPQYSSTPATSRFEPRYCHTHLELPCQSSTHDAHCSRDPAWEDWVFEVGEGREAWLEDRGWQVLGAASLGTCLQESEGEHSVQSWDRTPQGWWGRHTGRSPQHFHTVRSHRHPAVSHTHSHPRSDARPVPPRSLGHRRTGRSQADSGT